MQKKIVIANWKMNPLSLAEAISLAKKTEAGTARFKNVEIVVAPPLPFLPTVKKVLKRSKLGAQNVFWSDRGPYTGEVSAPQLKNIGVTHVIVGHSERKIHLGESDEIINKKAKAVLGNGLVLILCIGEQERIDEEIPEILGEQLKKVLSGVKKVSAKNFIVAYEPIWAISTMSGSRPDTPDNAFRVVLYIRKILAGFYGPAVARSIRIIYGGSVKAANAEGFIKQGRTDGLLVGGASLDAEEFVKIISAVNR